MAEIELGRAFLSIAVDRELSLFDANKWFEEAEIVGQETGITEDEITAIITMYSKDNRYLEFDDLKNCVYTLAEAKDIKPKLLMANLIKARVKYEFEMEAFESKAKGGKLSLQCIKKWFKDAGVIGKSTGITEADVTFAVNEISSDKSNLDFNGLKQCISTLAVVKKVVPNELMDKLVKDRIGFKIELEVFESMAEGKNISRNCIKKWFKSAGIVSKKTRISEADVDSVVTDVSKGSTQVDFIKLRECVTILAKKKKIEMKELMTKLINCKAQSKKLKPSTSTGKDSHLSLNGVKKWFKDAGVIDEKMEITENDLDAAIFKTCKNKEVLNMADLKACVNILAKSKKLEANEIIQKLIKAGVNQNANLA